MIYISAGVIAKPSDRDLVQQVVDTVNGLGGGDYVTLLTMVTPDEVYAAIKTAC